MRRPRRGTTGRRAAHGALGSLRWSGARRSSGGARSAPAQAASARRAAAAVPRARARRARLILLAVGVGTGLLGLGARCAHLQIIKSSELLDLARTQQEKEVVLDPHRGPIVDRNGKELALSLAVDSVYADPAEVGDLAAAARRLAPVLGLRAGEVREHLEGGRHFAWLKRKITPDLRRRVEALKMPGIGFVRESRRYYPKRKLAAHVVGACGLDNQGLAGLEFAYDTAVRGTPGRMRFLRDGRGGAVLDRTRVEPTAGTGLALTLDEVIQHLAERELDAVMERTSARGAAAVVLQPRTGEILALASRPTYDPNSYSSAREDARRNRAVTDFYEPGSTFKVVTAAAVLDLGRVRPDETIWCGNGSIVVARHRFNEDSHPFGNLTFTEVLARSSNIGAITVARRLEPREFLDAIRSFGFGRKTGIELPGENPGMLRDLVAWSGLSQASLAIGQEIGVTPLQLAAAVGVVAGDGVWVRPHVVQATFGPDGRRVPAPGDGPGRRVISETTARTLRRMLQSVLGAEGTGRAAAVPGYSVGGKTGTAQKSEAGGGYSRDRHVAWFAGFVPADRPALVIVVMVDEPKGPSYHGGAVAAPVFAHIALPALQYLGVPPDRDGTLVFEPAPQAEWRDGGTAARPGTALPAVRHAPRDGAGRPDVSEASILTLPAGLTVPAPADAEGPQGPATMPDLGGMSLRQVTEVLAAAGLVCRTIRSGPRVTLQDPEPGEAVRPGRACSVTY
jgi:cell division protein FtsI/penicillin-binding protein 2